ncbi:hypothetical protein Cfor_00699, partial [Coptotermes formosanus]
FRCDAINRLIWLTEPFSWEELPTKNPETRTLTMAGWIPRVQLIAKRIIQFIIIYHPVYTAIRIVVSPNRPLSFNGWFPFNATVSPTYELVNLIQFFAVLSYDCVTFGFNALYATFICIACSQLEKLRGNLAHIRQKQVSSDEADQEEERQVQTSQKVCSYMQKQLNDCIRQHQEILSYVRVLEQTLNQVVAGIFLLALGALCFGSFSIVTSWGNYVQMSQGMVSYLVNMTMLAIYTWFGYELTSQVERVRDAAWGCDWVGTPLHFQKSIRVIISSANKECILTAGKFVPVTVRTMVNV